MSGTGGPGPIRSRAGIVERLQTDLRWDLVVVGGGATGLGVALDAAARGHRVALLEARDFAAGTSSRSTKLVHGGVRYLAQGNIGLVREALRERSFLLGNAPHLARPLRFVMPSYRYWETPFYGIGLKLYDHLAGHHRLGATQWLTPAQTRDRLPGLRADGLTGGVSYYDGQFDDARLAIALARTAQAHGAVLLNHCTVSGLTHVDGRLSGVVATDAESGRTLQLKTRCVVNATGVWVDRLRDADRAAADAPADPLLSPSQGVHIVVDRDFLPGDSALLIPKTADGRVLFGVPWMGKVVLGTTDTPRPDAPAEPRALPAEIDFILGEAGRYLARAPRADDVRSIWAGLRPLVRAPRGEDRSTGALSREHTVVVARSGLVTVTGGKWTTYRAMAEDVLARCADAGLIPPRQSLTAHLRLAGAPAERASGAAHRSTGCWLIDAVRGSTAGSTAGDAGALAGPPGPHLYGTDAATLAELPGHDRMLGGGLTEAMVRFAARFEYARTVEDVLARRSRLLFTDAALASGIADAVGALLAEETGRDPAVAAFRANAAGYRLGGGG